MKKKQIPPVTFDEALSHFGRQVAMADWADVGRSAVAYWKKVGRLPPGPATRFHYEIRLRGGAVR